MASAWRVCEQMGIQMLSKRHFRNGPLEPRQTRSRAAIKQTAETGEAMQYPELVYDVLGLIIASDGNARQLYGETIQGVARWVIASRLRTADIPFIQPAFCEINLGLVRESVMHYRIANRPPQIAFMTAGLLEPAMEMINYRFDLNAKKG